MAPRRSRKKAGKVAPGAERRRQRRLEDEAMLDLMDTCDLTEDEFLPRLETSRERRVIDLNLAKCSMSVLPDSIGGLKALETLDLTECENLITLPESIGGLTALHTLALDHCFALAALPAAIGELKSLTVLNLCDCSSLTTLPDTIGGLTALKELDLKGCKILAALPPAIEAMPNLDIKGWEPPLAGCERFADLARPRVKALYPERADEDIDGMISRYYWSSVCERAKIDDTHDGMVYEQFLVDNFIEVIRRIRRRICDACGRRGEIEEDRFPVCWCGARRYCGEECQKLDWDRGHSRTCASGYTWSATDLHWFRRFEEDRVLREQVVDDGHPSFLFDEGMVQLRQALITRNPPPADRER